MYQNQLPLIKLKLSVFGFFAKNVLYSVGFEAGLNFQFKCITY